MAFMWNALWAFTLFCFSELGLGSWLILLVRSFQIKSCGEWNSSKPSDREIRIQSLVWLQVTGVTVADYPHFCLTDPLITDPPLNSENSIDTGFLLSLVLAWLGLHHKGTLTTVDTWHQVKKVLAMPGLPLSRKWEPQLFPVGICIADRLL